MLPKIEVKSMCSNATDYRYCLKYV